MLGISEIGKNTLTQGAKSMPAFGSAYTPSFGNTTYHDEFVSSHDSGGVTAKQIGLFALVGLAVGAVVALALKKPSAATVEAADATEFVEKVVEYRLDERGWLKRLFTSTPEEIKLKAERKAAKAAAKAEVKTAKVAAKAETKAAKIEAKTDTKEAKLEAKTRIAEAKAKLKEAKTSPSTPSSARAAGATALDTPPLDKMGHARKIHELTEELKEAEAGYSEKRGLYYRFSHSLDGKEPDRKGIKAIKAELSRAEKAAKEAGYKPKELKKIKPEDFTTVEPLEPPTPVAATPGPAPAPATGPAPAPAATTPPGSSNSINNSRC